MHAFIAGIEYCLPIQSLTTEDLVEEFPEWLSLRKTIQKTGVQRRQIADIDECASDLGVQAAQKLFAKGDCNPKDIDFILFCTQTADYALPATACLVQDRLGISTTSGALDINMGCSGFIYSLGLAIGLINSGQANSILLITAETISKYLDRRDRSSRAIFGDGAAAIWIRSGERQSIGPFCYGTDGSGGENLIVRDSGMRRSLEQENSSASSENPFGARTMFMDGQKIFDFALRVVPLSVSALLQKSGLTVDDIGLFVLHQANAYLLEELRKMLGIAKEKFQITISDCANTVSSTIPIALKHADLEGKLKNGEKIMLVGFGVGYSWAACIVEWKD